MGAHDVEPGVRGPVSLTAPRDRSKVAAMADPGSVKRRRPLAGGEKRPERGFRFGPVNYALLGGGLAAIALGYALLDGGSVTAAPLLLTLGYVILLPLGILLGWKTFSTGD